MTSPLIHGVPPSVRRCRPRRRSTRAWRFPSISGSGELLGVLTLYAESPETFSTLDTALAEALGTHAALAVTAARRRIQFALALRSRDVIGQAKGMIMERFAIDANAAFGLLVKLSPDSNIRVADIAERLVETGQVASR